MILPECVLQLTEWADKILYLVQLRCYISCVLIYNTLLTVLSSYSQIYCLLFSLSLHVRD